MKVDKQTKKMEALERMKKMGVWLPVVECFWKYDEIHRSEQPFGVYYELDGEEMEEIKAIEKEYGFLVYMVIRTETGFGTLDALLFVNDDPTEWVMDMEDLENGTAYAYVINRDIPVFSEFGQIAWKSTGRGGVLRVM